MSVVDLTPTWVSAVRIYCEVLQNPDAGHTAKRDAVDDLVRLARYVDAHQSAILTRDDPYDD